MANHKTKKKQHKVDSSFCLRPTAASVRLALTGMLVGTLAQTSHAELPVAAQNWVGSGAATKAINGTRMDINQSTNKVILNWQSFNIGASNHVNFNQPGATAVALNRIGQSDPSKILGSLTANGQIHLINKNGFIFGKNSVINVNSLIASTHNISDNVFERGLTRVFDETGEAAFVLDEEAVAANYQELKKILVEQGANITADDAGRIIMVAPEVENNGSLSVGKKGQIMLVASQDKVYLQQADSEDFAGLLVEVDTGGKVSNFGEMLAEQGNITMAGFAVKQGGRITATTSVNANGSIRLLAREGKGLDGTKLIPTRTTRTLDKGDDLGLDSVLSFAEGSLTSIEATNAEGNAVDEQQQLDSFLEASAHTIRLQSNSQIKAPSANVVFTATDNLRSPEAGNKGRIEIAQGSVIDVSGYDGVEVAMERNVVKVEPRSFELRDSPEQRDGVLYAEDVYVDIRQGTDLVDYSGAEARIERSARERMTTGGSINLTASGDVLIEDGAMIDISGGSVDYQRGTMTTTVLVNQTGELIDIGAADINDTFIDIGLRSYTEAGYKEGKNAGALSISTAALDWQGDLAAVVSNGRLQRTRESMARGGSFNIDLAAFLAAQDFSIRNDREINQLLASGLQDFSLKTLGDVRIESDTRLSFAPFSNVEIIGGSLNVAGEIYTAGGDINLQAQLNEVVGATGEVTLSAGALLDSSGRWVNDYVTASSAINPQTPIAIDGGNVALSSEGDLTLDQGSRIQADGGAHYTEQKVTVAGDGGEISLSALGKGISNPGLLTLNGGLSALSLEKNGTLTLRTHNIVVGDRNFSDVATDTLYVDGNHSLFSQFADVTLAAVNQDVKLTSQADIDMTQQNRIFLSGYSSQGNARTMDAFTRLIQYPQYLRKENTLTLDARRNVEMYQGASIATEADSVVKFVASNSIFVDGRIDASASDLAFNIVADRGQFNPAQAVWLGEHADISARGTVILQPDPFFRTGTVLDGGNLSIETQRGYIVVEQGALIDLSGTSTTLDIANNGTASLGVTRKTVGSDAGSFDFKTAEGLVLEGSLVAHAGTSSNRGGHFNVTLDRASRQDPFNILPSPELQIQVKQGTDSAFSQGLAFNDAIASELQGRADIYTGLFAASGMTGLSLNTPDTIYFNGDISLAMAERIQLDARTIGASGSANVRLDAPHLSIQHTLKDIDESVVSRTVAGLPDQGDGVFTAQSDWMQLTGVVQMNHWQQVNLHSTHDMQLKGINSNPTDQRDFLGELVTAANLNLQASQIYPSTLSDYRFAVSNNADGSINIASTTGDTHLPLSAGGTLSFEAAHIEQAGVVRAPLGKINLLASETLRLAAGSETSVSADGLVIPYGVTEAGLDWLYPLNSVNKLVVDKAPDKKIKLSAASIELAEGSVVDLSAGGDLLAYEFIPGLGGSFDYLDPAGESYAGGFAVLPGLGQSLAPFDHFQSKDGYAAGAGDSVYLAGGNGLAAGFYSKLPAHYALLPGAYLVTPVSDTQDHAITTRTLDGREIVAGYNTIAGTNIRDSRSSGFLLENGNQVRQHSEYTTSTIDSFITAKASREETALPGLARDAGLIAILAETRLALNASFKVNADHGDGAKMDIAADKIHVVSEKADTADGSVLEVLASDLSNLNIASLFLGGGRSDRNTQGETELDVIASEVRVKQDAELTVGDLVLAAKETVTVDDNAKLVTDAAVNTGDTVLVVEGDGALLRVSGADQVGMARRYSENQPRGQKGDLVIAQGALLNAGESMLIDASRSTSINGDIVMDGGSLNLSANRINLGNVENLADNGALNLSNSDLAQLTVDELILTSRNTVNLIGDVGLRQHDGSLEALNFQRLQLDAMGLIGEPGEQSVSIKAVEIALQNSQDTDETIALINSLPTSSAGNLAIEGDTISTGSGTFILAGFDNVDLTAGKSLTAMDEGALKVAADLNINATVLTAASNGDLNVDAAGYSILLSDTDIGKTADSEQALTGALAFTADEVTLNTRVVLPSGRLALTALNGDVVVGDRADVDLAGRQLNFADQILSSTGGEFVATSETSSIVLAEGSAINLDSGSLDIDGGSLQLNAQQGNVNLGGEISAQHGAVEIDVAALGDQTGFDDFLQKLSDAGVDRSVDIRSRTGDMTVAQEQQIIAESIELTADRGKIEIAGQLNANSELGGEIVLNAGDEIILASTGGMISRGLGDEASGGKVTLSSFDDDQDGMHGIQLHEDGLIDVSGTVSGGEVYLRAERTDSNNDGLDDDVAIAAIGAQVIGADKFVAEGVKKYQGADLQIPGQIRQADINLIKIATDQYMTVANRQAVESRLGAGVRLNPVIEITHDADLTLAAELDTADWRYPSIWDTAEQSFDPAVGRFVITSDSDVNIDKSISDGFKDGTVLAFGGFYPVPISDQLMTDRSWSFDIHAGGNINLAANTHIRTGTGDLLLQAGGDINFADETVSIINAGHADKQNRYGTLSDDFVATAAAFSFPQKYMEFAQDGGDLVMDAKGRINGEANEGQYMDEWLIRHQPDAFSSDVKPTVWGVDPNKFNQNVGSFGGGKVVVVAQQNINDLSVMMPTSGKQTGAQDPLSGGFGFIENKVEVLGGGVMNIYAGNNIVGGSFMLGQGQGRLSAGGAITGSNVNKNGPLLSLGDTRMTVAANDDISLTGVTDPMMADSGDVNFFSYQADSTLNILSQSGDIRLGAKRTDFIGVDSKSISEHEFLANVYPATLNAFALGGSLEIAQDTVLFPSAQGDLNLFAQKDISSDGGRKWVTLSDADSTLLPDWKNPIAQNQIKNSKVANRLSASGDRQYGHAATPVHLDDPNPVRIVTREGNIGGISFNVAKRIELSAGRDITSTQIVAENIDRNDYSSIIAGRDIRFPIVRGENGSAIDDDSRIEIAGPGLAFIKAGRNVDLGRGIGISTVGDQINPALADQGADVMVLAGINSAPDYLAFIDYLKQTGDYEIVRSNGRTSFSHRLEPIDSAGYDLLSFEDLLTEINASSYEYTDARLADLTLPTFYNELLAAGSTDDIGRGFDAIDTLLPGDQWNGDINLFFSKIHTVDGGSINLFAPGGDINAGLAAVAGNQKDSSQLGIVAQQQGSINNFLSGNYSVNQSRVFALGGSDEFYLSDILVWSSFGNIDAGRGAKSALSVPPPETKFDENGNLVTEFPPAISGSGIRTASSGNRKAGNVALFAPNGVINAAEAGIGGNNIILVAKAVLGASNIDVGGTGVGVPTQTASVAPSAGISSNSTASVSKSAQNSVQGNADDDNEQRMALGMLSVEVVGFGGSDNSDDDSRGCDQQNGKNDPKCAG